MKTMTLPGGEPAVLVLHIPLISGYGNAAGAHRSYRTANLDSWCAALLAPGTLQLAA